MMRIALIYGAFSGAIVIGSMILGFILSGGEGAYASQFFGYLVMLVALSMIFIGIKRYRDRKLGGVIKFVPAFLLGLGISATAGVIYVAVWEIYLALTDYAFIHDYAASFIETKKAAGVAGAALEEIIADMEQMVKNYGNPFYRLPITFMEIFPVGLAITLVSAAILRNPRILPARAS